MTALQHVRDAGQSLWLDSISRSLIDDGRLARYIEQYGITGLTSNPAIFDVALGEGGAYDEDIRAGTRDGLAGEALFAGLALADLRRAAALLRPCFDSSRHADGWVSMEVSPLLAADTAATVAAARKIHADAACANLLVKIPGTPEGLPAVEQTVFAGIPVNVTLLFSREQYLAANDACLRGIERRIVAGLDPKVATVASLFVSRWDVAANSVISVSLQNRLGIAVARQVWRSHVDTQASPRWQAALASGAPPQRLLWASTGSKDPAVSDTHYVDALIAPGSINTLPEATLLAFADHGRPQPAIADDGGDCDAVIARIDAAGVKVALLADRLQRDGVGAFAKAWRQLLKRIDSRHSPGAAVMAQVPAA